MLAAKQRFRAKARKARPLSISGTPVTTATEGVIWAGFTVTARGGKTPYVYSATGLPAWTSINSATGVVASATAGSPATITGIDIYVTDAVGRVAHLTPWNLTINAATGFFVTASAASYAPNAAFMPRLLDRFVPRTTLVPAGEDRINLREAMVWPHSGPATQYMISGGNAYLFDSDANDEIKLATATRAGLAPGDYPITVTPLQGASFGTAKTLTVRLMPTDKCLFISQSIGSEVANGFTPTTPRKYLPDTRQATGSKIAIGAGWCVFMRREKHRAQHTKNNTLGPNYTTVGYHGASGADSINHLWVEFGGYGSAITRPTLSGDEALTGGTTPTQAEVDGNPGYLSILKYDLQGQSVEAALGRWGASAYDGPDLLWRAQFPLPAIPFINKLPDGTHAVGSETGGFRKCPIAASGTSFMKTDNADLVSPTSTITIKDPIFASRYGNVVAGKLPRILILTGNNNTGEFDIGTYDYATSTITLNNTTEVLGVNSGYGGFAVLHSKADLTVGTYALDVAKQYLYVWPKTNTEVTYSRRERAVDWGFDLGGYVTYADGIIEHFCDTQQRGAAFDCYAGNQTIAISEPNIIAMWVRQCSGESLGTASRGAGLDSASLTNPNIELNRFTENQSSGFRFTLNLLGPAGTNLANIDAATKGKFQANSFELYGIDRSAFFLLGADGFQGRWNNLAYGQTLHGDGFPIYNNYPPQIADNCKFNENDFIATARAFTFDGSDDSVSLEISSNLILNGDDSNLVAQNASIQGWNGWPGGEIKRNIILNAGTNNYPTAVQFSRNSQPWNFHNNVTLGISMPTGWTGSIANNLITASPSVNDNLTHGGSNSGNTVLTGGSRIFQFTGITAAMESALGSGPIGCFRSVP